jgi:hypothetical protein
LSAQSVRDAVAAGDYSAAAALFDQYARSLPVNEASLAELGELANWTRLTVLCAKAHSQEQASRLQAELQVVSAYGR